MNIIKFILILSLLTVLINLFRTTSKNKIIFNIFISSILIIKLSDDLDNLIINAMTYLCFVYIIYCNSYFIYHFLFLSLCVKLHQLSNHCLTFYIVGYWTHDLCSCQAQSAIAHTQEVLAFSIAFRSQEHYLL